MVHAVADASGAPIDPKNVGAPVWNNAGKH